MAFVATDLTNQLGVVFWFVWVDCFLHRDSVFFLDAICFVALAGATFSFAVAGLSTIEALSLESFSFRMCRCCSCWRSCCTSWWVGGDDRVKWLNCRRRCGVLLVLVLAHQVRLHFLWGTLFLVCHCEFLMNFDWKLAEQEHFDGFISFISKNLLRGLLQAFEGIAKCLCSGVVTVLIPLVTGHFLKIFFGKFFPEQF